MHAKFEVIYNDQHHVMVQAIYPCDTKTLKRNKKLNSQAVN